MFIIVLGQHVSILIESSSGPSKEIDPYLEMFKMSCGIPNAYILDKKYILNVCVVVFLLYNQDDYCTIRIQRRKHFIHIFIKNVSFWDPTEHFKNF